MGVGIKLAVLVVTKVVRSDVKFSISTCHVGKSEGAIRLQQLSIGFHLNLIRLTNVKVQHKLISNNR